MNKEEIVVGAGNGLANVFVYVKEGVSGTYPAPATPVVLDQKGCAYRPHVFGVMTGQPIDILNSDDTLHNVHAIPEVNKAFNQGMPVPGSKVSKSFTKPEVMVRIKCDVHGWMSSWAGVLPHPFFAVSGEDGSFTIKGLPAGTYVIEAWHEKLGTQTQKVTVGENEAKSAAFAFKPAA
jgi:plastocyanin